MFRRDQTLLFIASAAASAIALAPTASAQLSYGGEPAALRGAFSRPAPQHSVPAPDVSAYMAEDEARDHRPLRYGAMVALDLDLSDGQWTDLPDRSRAWRISLTSPGAKSLAVEFDQLYLPAGAEMFVYTEDFGTVLGAYTIQNHHHDGGFVFEPVAGEEITIEIDVPEGIADPVFDTATLIYDYRDVFGLMDGTEVVHEHLDPGSCLVDVNCPQGDAWENQKRATMRTLSAGSLCSGALLNNTAKDGTGYVLTANHCGQTSNTIFRFKYQRAGCGSGSSPTTFSVSGATNLASNGTYDNRLMRINSAIPASHEPYYAGWSRSNVNSSYAFAMGHPSGGPKKISIDQNGAIRESQFWRVFWSEGTLEGGSSGGPLFDQAGLVRGPACCVNQFSCNQTAYFGRFDQFYNANNLGQWLDPLGTNPTTLNGYDPFGCPDPSVYCGTSPNSVGAGASIGFTGSASQAANDLALNCFGLVPGTPGLFFYGPNQTAVLLGEGVRCVDGNLTRLDVQVADSFGSVIKSINWFGNPFLVGPGAVQPGDAINFQYWYRDVAGGLIGYNLSDGIQMDLCD